MKDVCVGHSFVLSVALRIVVMCALAFIVFVCVSYLRSVHVCVHVFISCEYIAI